jgi:pyruvate formate lyase activating enzyme
MPPAADEPVATVFDIQSFSLHDGPGIRTTVFLKGCPLRCVWCHNPESLSRRPQLMVNQRLCSDCGACVEACPNGAHAMPQGRHALDFARCSGAGECVAVCGYDALALVGADYTAAGLWERLAPDLHYFGLALGAGVGAVPGSGNDSDATGWTGGDADSPTGDCADSRTGGVTFSGGEPLLHAAFIRRFAELAPRRVHLVVETSGWVPPAAFQLLNGVVDCYLFDYKATDPVRHQELTGQDNSLILQNLDRLCAQGAEIVLRLPVVPGLNDSEDHFRGIAELLRRHPGIRRAEILGYHSFGEDKHARLGRPGEGYRGRAATAEDKASWRDRLEALGVNGVVIG